MKVLIKNQCGYSMKIAMILDKPFPPDPRVENEAVTLVKNGHEVHLFSLDYENRKSFEIINRVNVHRFEFSSYLRKKIAPLVFKIPIYHWLLKSKVESFIEKNDFDVIHVHDLEVAGLIFKLNKKMNLPVVLDLHENKPEIMKNYTHVNSFLGKLLINPEQWEKNQVKYCNLCDNLILVTEEAKKDYVKQFNIPESKIVVVPNTVRYDEFISQQIDEIIMSRYKQNFVLLYVGDTGPRRGTDTAIEAINYLNKEISNVKLVLVGKSKDDYKLKAMIKKYQLEDYVDLLGWQDFKLFPSYISASDVCLSPLKKNKHHYTTYANKIFQYMSLGKPIVVSDCMAQANVVKSTNSGLIHEAENALDLSEKVLKLYNNRELKIKLGQNAKTAAKEKYNWHRTSRELVQLYERIENEYKK